MRRLVLLVVAAVTLGACGTTSIFEISEGDCFDDVSDFSEVSRLPVVDCDEPHDNEVYAVFDYLGSPDFPGEDEMGDIAFDECIERFEDFVGLDYFDSEIFASAFWPSPATWADGDREVICFVYEGDLSKITGTLRGAGR